MMASTPRAAAVIAAAGKGTRMGAGKNKVFLPLEGRPLLWHSVRAFIEHPWVEQVVVVGKGKEGPCVQAALSFDDCSKAIAICQGGATRQASVLNGLQQTNPALPLVLVHDGARPLVSPALIGRVLEAAWTHGAALPGVPLSDSLKRVDHQAVVDEVPRAGVYRAQTPQAFRRALLLEALIAAQRAGKTFTDDAGVVAHFARVRPRLVPGDPANLKVTTPFDLALATYLFSLRQTKDEGPLA